MHLEKINLYELNNSKGLVNFMEQKRCFFIGHRDTPETVKSALQEAVVQHIVEYGVTEFLVGSYGAFDRMAAECVIAAKKQHPQVVLTLLLPYHPGGEESDFAHWF